MFIDLSILFTPEDLARKQQAISTTVAQTVINLIFNFYTLLPHPQQDTPTVYWQRHHTAYQTLCNAIYREEFSYHSGVVTP